MTLLGYECVEDNPCTADNRGSRFPHRNPANYIVCDHQCNVMHCAVGKYWDRNVTACVTGF